MNVFVIQAMKVRYLMRPLAVPISMNVGMELIHVSKIVSALILKVHLNANVNLDSKDILKLRLLLVNS